MKGALILAFVACVFSNPLPDADAILKDVLNEELGQVKASPLLKDVAKEEESADPMLNDATNDDDQIEYQYDEAKKEWIPKAVEDVPKEVKKDVAAPAKEEKKDVPAPAKEEKKDAPAPAKKDAPAPAKEEEKEHLWMTTSLMKQSTSGYQQSSQQRMPLQQNLLHQS